MQIQDRMHITQILLEDCNIIISYHGISAINDLLFIFQRFGIVPDTGTPPIIAGKDTRIKVLTYVVGSLPVPLVVPKMSRLRQVMRQMMVYLFTLSLDIITFYRTSDNTRSHNRMYKTEIISLQNEKIFNWKMYLYCFITSQ